MLNDWAGGRKAAQFAPLAVLTTGPLAALLGFVLLGSSHGIASVAAVAPETVRIGSTDVTARQGVDVRFGLGKPPTAIARASGTVTELDVATSSVVTQAQIVARIDDVPLRALVGTLPLYRPLKVGVTGPDVSELTDFLTASGHLGPSTEPSAFGPAMLAAVNEYQRSELRIEPTGVFDPGYVVFVPAASHRVTSVTAQVGDAVSGPFELMALDPAPTSVALSSATGGAALRDLEDQPVTLSIGRTRVEWSSPRARAAEVENAYSAFLLGSQEGSVTRVPGVSGEEAMFGGAFIELSRPRRFGSVPATALYVNGTGRTCLFTPSKDGASYAAIPLSAVAALSAVTGQSFVDAGLVGKRVLRMPHGLDRETLGRCT